MSTLPDIFFPAQQFTTRPPKQGPMFTLKYLSQTLKLKSSAQNSLIQPQQQVGFHLIRNSKSRYNGGVETDEPKKKIKRVSFSSDAHKSCNGANLGKQKNNRSFSKRSFRSIHDDTFGLANGRAYFSIEQKQQKGLQAESIIHKHIQSQQEIYLANQVLTEIKSEANQVRNEFQILQKNALKNLDELSYWFEMEMKKLKSNLSFMRRLTGQQTKFNQGYLDEVEESFQATRDMVRKIEKTCEDIRCDCFEHTSPSGQVNT